jgi:hypothetical protein
MLEAWTIPDRSTWSCFPSTSFSLASITSVPAWWRTRLNQSFYYAGDFEHRVSFREIMHVSLVPPPTQISIPELVKSVTQNNSSGNRFLFLKWLIYLAAWNSKGIDRELTD